MLIYSQKLEKYITKKLLPYLLIYPKQYKIKGSFRRKVPYVTDIDMTNTLFPDIPKEKVYDLFCQVLVELPQDIIFIRAACGTDDRFDIFSDDHREVERIASLLNDQERSHWYKLIDENKNNPDKLFTYKEFLKPYYKIRFNKQEILNDEKILPGQLKVKFSELILATKNMVVRYCFMIGSHPLGIDIGVYYDEQIDERELYRSIKEQDLARSRSNKEYFYMIFHLRNYMFFTTEQPNRMKFFNELNNFIEKTCGPYKQLSVIIKQYFLLSSNDCLSEENHKKIIKGIINDLFRIHLPQKNLSKSVVSLFHELHKTIPHNMLKMYHDSTTTSHAWTEVLNHLTNVLQNFLDNLSIPIYYHYLDKILPDDQPTFTI